MAVASEHSQCLRRTWVAGQGVTLNPGSYSEPISFAGIYGFNQWGLRLLVSGQGRLGWEPCMARLCRASRA